MITEANIATIDWEKTGVANLKHKLGQFVAQLQQMMEVNNGGDYRAYIDPTVIAEVIPYCETLDDLSDDQIKKATVKIDFEDGIPVVEGIPFWERLDGEPIDYYKIFKAYRDMKYENVVITGTTASHTVINNRSIAKLAELHNISGRILTTLSKIYHWSLRCKSFDFFKIREISLKKQHQAEELECKHSKYSNELLEQAIKYLKEHPSQLDPKVALQMVEIGMKYGRISVGLLGDKPGSSASAVHQTNINVSQTNNTADQMLNMQTGASGNDTNQGSKGSGCGSDVERQYANNLKEESNLVSILHVLNKSGAFKNAISPEDKDKQVGKDEGDDFSDVIDITPVKDSKEGEES